MRPYPRPKVVVSACLEFDSVRYDGKVVPCPIVRELMPFADFIKVCPEHAIGLGVPRDPLRLVRAGGGDRLVQPRTGRDVTGEMDAFTDRFLASLPPVDGFLFKSGSPTIGLYNIKAYDHPIGSGVAGRTSGLFARKIVRQFAGYPMEDDLRLRNGKIRGDYLTRLFAFAGCREAVESGDPAALADFHERNGYLFMCYEPEAEHVLGGALERGGPAGYFEAMKAALSRAPTAVSYAGVALRIFKKYEDRLSPGERAWFRALLEKYRKNQVGRDGLLEALELFAVRMGDGPMAGQTLFAPYPPELLQEADQGRDRDYWKALSVR